MALPQEYKKYNIINKYTSAYQSKAYYTKVNQSGQRVNTSPMMHEGFYNMEVASAVTVANGINGSPNRNNILEIGFGLGYSAQKFIDMGVRSYTCIEINDELYANAVSWANGFETETQINIYNGDWRDIMPQFSNGFHGVYYSMYDEVGDEKNLSNFMRAAGQACFIGAICSVQGLPLFSNFDLSNYSTGEIPESPSPSSFDSVFNYTLYYGLNDIGYFNVYIQYWNGLEWIREYRGDGGGDIGGDLGGDIRG